tara:strand:+ start:827 stop:1114 length:288 start_codon:yes stop_codon:yes gene_type:complete
MIIDFFEISNLILDKKQYCKVEDKYESALLLITEEEPIFSVGCGGRIVINEFYKPFNIKHPMLKKYTFTLNPCQQKNQCVSLLETMLNKFEKTYK